MAAALFCGACETVLESPESACARCGSDAWLSLRCQEREALYLASLSGGKFVVGIPDAFAECTPEETARLCREARTTLRLAGVLRGNGSSSDVTICDPVATWMRTVSSPTRVFTVRSLEGGRPSPADRCVYQTDDCIVDLEIAAEWLSLRSRSDLRFLAETLRAQWSPDTIKPIPTGRLLLSETVMTATRADIARGDLAAALGCLLAHGIPQAEAKALLLTLATPRQSGVLVRLTWTGRQWASHGVGVLRGELGAYQIRVPDGAAPEPGFELLPADGAAIADALQGLLAAEAQPIGRNLD